MTYFIKSHYNNAEFICLWSFLLLFTSSVLSLPSANYRCNATSFVRGHRTRDRRRISDYWDMKLVIKRRIAIHELTLFNRAPTTTGWEGDVSPDHQEEYGRCAFCTFYWNSSSINGRCGYLVGWQLCVHKIKSKCNKSQPKVIDYQKTYGMKPISSNFLQMFPSWSLITRLHYLQIQLPDSLTKSIGFQVFSRCWFDLSHWLWVERNPACILLNHQDRSRSRELRWRQ